MKISRSIISKVIDQLSGISFENSDKYSQQEKKFYQERYEKIISLVPKIDREDRGLEIGLSGGILAFSIKRAYKLYRLYALEHPIICDQYSEKFLHKLESEAICLRKVDLREHKLPWRDGYFDFIVLSEVIEHLVPADVPFLIKEIERVLDYNGWLLLTTPNVSSLLKRMNLLFGKNSVKLDTQLHGGATYGHIREYTLSEIFNLFGEGLFRFEKKGYFMTDTKRSLFTRIENVVSKIIPSMGNSMFVLLKRR